MLKDIGVRRDEIREVVEAMLEAPAARPAAPPPVTKAGPFMTSEIPAAANDNKAVIAVAH